MNLNPHSTPGSDPVWEEQLQRLHQLMVYSRWILIVVSWCSLGILSLWSLQEEIVLVRSHFTWAAVRYGLIAHPLASFSLVFCIALTTAVLVWQSRNILFGLDPQERQKLEKQLLRIRQSGSNHPLWKWVIEPG